MPYATEFERELSQSVANLNSVLKSKSNDKAYIDAEAWNNFWGGVTAGGGGGGRAQLHVPANHVKAVTALLTEYQSEFTKKELPDGQAHFVLGTVPESNREPLWKRFMTEVEPHVQVYTSGILCIITPKEYDASMSRLLKLSGIEFQKTPRGKQFADQRVFTLEFPYDPEKLNVLSEKIKIEKDFGARTRKRSGAKEDGSTEPQGRPR